MKYKELKPITASEIYEAGNKTSSCFKEEFDDFLEWAWHDLINILGQRTFYFFLPIRLSDLETAFPDHPEWAPWFIEHGFIAEVEEEVFYHVGQKFEHHDSKLILSRINANSVALIPYEGNFCIGNRYTQPIAVQDDNHITPEEFRIITDAQPIEDFKLIEE